ncbi:hypothetical protein LINGRAHAP2_LOCUS22583 [Linum grandiflorum]
MKTMRPNSVQNELNWAKMLRHTVLSVWHGRATTAGSLRIFYKKLRHAMQEGQYAVQEPQQCHACGTPCQRPNSGFNYLFPNIIGGYHIFHLENLERESDEQSKRDQRFWRFERKELVINAKDSNHDWRGIKKRVKDWNSTKNDDFFYGYFFFYF